MNLFHACEKDTSAKISLDVSSCLIHPINYLFKNTCFGSEFLISEFFFLKWSEHIMSIIWSIIAFDQRNFSWLDLVSVYFPSVLTKNGRSTTFHISALFVSESPKKIILTDRNKLLFISKLWKTTDLVTFNEKILNRNFILCSMTWRKSLT